MTTFYSWISKITGSFRAIWQTTIWRAIFLDTINASRTPRDRRATLFNAAFSFRMTRDRNAKEEKDYHLLDGTYASQCPEIAVRDVWVFLTDLLQLGPCDTETGVATVGRFWLEAHRRFVGSSSLIILVVRARCMPRQPKQHRAVTTI